jgi:4,5-DOPA dioxygenase extradiol
MPALPTLFISHGAPTTPIEDIPARKFLVGLGRQYRQAQAVLCVSAHWETPSPAVSAVPEPETIHDFYGFPAELYRIQYPAHGDSALAGRAAQLLESAGIKCDVNDSRGLDHGAWVPLTLMYPEADVPVIQLSIQHHLDPARHLALGQAIEPLRHEGVLILGSGGAVHPLGYPGWTGPGSPTDQWASDFAAWLTDAVARGDTDSLLKYRKLAPYPERAHPRPDHYMPLLAALGAAGPGARGNLIHDSWYWGDLGMGAYEFNV